VCLVLTVRSLIIECPLHSFDSSAHGKGNGNGRHHCYKPIAPVSGEAGPSVHAIVNTDGSQHVVVSVHVCTANGRVLLCVFCA